MQKNKRNSATKSTKKGQSKKVTQESKKTETPAGEKVLMVSDFPALLQAPNDVELNEKFNKVKELLGKETGTNWTTADALRNCIDARLKQLLVENGVKGN